MQSLKSVWDQGHLAIVHAAGSPDPTRSHFDAQDYMEIGTPGIKNTPDGWLNRSLAGRSSAPMSLRAIAMTARTPRMLSGETPVLTISSIDEFRLRNEQLNTNLQKLYANSTDPLFRQGGESLFQAMATLRRVQGAIPESTAKFPNGRFGQSMKQIARLIKSNVGLEIAFAEIEGWDTHVNEGGAKGQLANRLKELGEGLIAFYQDLGDRMEDVVVLTMSEFGRAVVENGIYFASQTGPGGAGGIFFYDFASRKARLISRVDKALAVTDSAFSVSPDRRSILYTQVDSSGSDIFILDRAK